MAGLHRHLFSLKFWSLICLGAFVIGAGDLLSVGIGSCSNRAVTPVDQFLMIGSALVFALSAAGIVVSGFAKLVSLNQSRRREAPPERTGIDNR
jgi:hypothetical protein